MGGSGGRPGGAHTRHGYTRPVLFFELFPAVMMILCFLVGVALYIANRRSP